jgi:hypothetical protein
MRRSTIWTLALVSCGVMLGNIDEARACGGCFHAENTTPSVVTGHRMALSISPQRTVLWDQVSYSGDPEDFAWVLPVGPGAYLELATDAWFESLEAVTGTRVMSQTLTCEGGSTISQGRGGGSGCMGGTASATELDGGGTVGNERVKQGDGDVTVVHEGTVGPYATVTLSSTDPLAMRDWLTGHGYVIPTEVEPVIDDYVAAGADFIALRLAPNQGVRQMRPVRVVTPGASPILPLRMVAAGTGALTSIVLYVIGEGRYGAQNFDNSIVDPGQLVWDWSTASSNYSALRTTATLGNRFLTSFARPRAIHAPLLAIEGRLAEYRVVGDFSIYETFADLYFGQASANGETDLDCPHLEALLDSDDVVVETCDDSGCAPALIDQIAAKDLRCGEADDIAAALIGMHPKDVWITRLEANLDRTAFGAELVLAATSQTEATNWHVASKNQNLPCVLAANEPSNDPVDDEADGGFCLCRFGTPVSNPLAAGTLMAAALLAVRRRRRRHG